VEPRTNPYTPNAGATPPLLVGRNDQLANFDLLLDRLRNGYPEQSMIITGLRGVGKTVLLNEFRTRTMSAQWAAGELEASKHDDTVFRRDMARQCRKALFSISPSVKWRDLDKRAAGVLRLFTLTLGTDGSVTAGHHQPPIEGLADSGVLDADLTDLLVALGDKEFLPLSAQVDRTQISRPQFRPASLDVPPGTAALVRCSRLSATMPCCVRREGPRRWRAGQKGRRRSSPDQGRP
jgi:hypothetical protein